MNIYDLSDDEFYEKVKEFPEEEQLQEIFNYTAYQVRRPYLSHMNFIFGGRGTGKTYTILKELVESDIKFIWLRDTETIIDKIARGNSLTAPIEIECESFPHIEIIKDDGNYKFVSRGLDGEIIKEWGYLMALSTFKNARGLDYSDIKCIVFDEFIPEKSAKKITFQDETFLNMYETVNRNRELKSIDPCQVIALANTNNIFSDILEALSLSNIIEEMFEKGNRTYKTDDVYIRFLKNKAFEEKKKKTLLYRLVASDSEFANMAINNNFNYSKALIDKKPNFKKSKRLFKLSNRYTALELADGTIYFKRANYKDNKLRNFDIENDNELQLYKYLFFKDLRNKYIIGKIKFDSIYTQKFILDISGIKK